jgi:hypothetical protein
VFLGNPRQTDHDLVDLARLSGLAHFIADLAHDETERLHTQNIEKALAASAFGVPTFVTDAGEVFFGQDRLPVLRHHLWGVRIDCVWIGSKNGQRLTGQPLSSELRSVLRADLMIRIAISAEAFEAIARTLPLGTVRAEFRCMT